MKVLIVTGGTGGHIYPALALADYIRKQTSMDICFVGNDDRMEAIIIPENGYRFYALHTSGLAGSFYHKGKAMMQSVMAIRAAKKIIKQFNPDVIISFGGYVSVPVILAAYRLKKKIILHEQNSIVGKANRLASRYADAVVVCYENLLDAFKDKPVYLYGNPRATVAANQDVDEQYFINLQLPKDRKLVLIVMGSLGSTSINEKMKDVLTQIPDAYFLYVSGKANYEVAKKELANEHVKVVDYVDQLAILKKFDAIICRSGATTAAEVCAAGVAAIFIPSPYVANNHQYYNANYLVERQSAWMILEKELTVNALYDKMNVVLHDDRLRQEVCSNAKRNSFPNACEDILRLIESLKE